jgi:hypothetical protein
VNLRGGLKIYLSPLVSGRGPGTSATFLAPILHQSSLELGNMPLVLTIGVLNVPLSVLWNFATVSVCPLGKTDDGEICTTYSTVVGNAGFTTETNVKGVGTVMTAFEEGETSWGRA